MQAIRRYQFIWLGLLIGTLCLSGKAQQPASRAQPLFEHVKTSLPATRKPISLCASAGSRYTVYNQAVASCST